jgi:Tfp pilus assembly protein PilV
VDLRRIACTLRRRLVAEEGFALLVALAAMLVLGVAGTSMFVYTDSNTAATRLTAAETSAHAVAEAGMQSMLAILNDPAKNALEPNLLACTVASNCTTTLSEGYAQWRGSLCDGSPDESGDCDRTWTGNPYWLLWSTGFVRNPNSGGNATQTIRARLTVVPTLTQPLNNPAWNYIYTTHPVTPGVCDETIQQKGALASPLYVSGNLCLQNTATIVGGPLDVAGSLTMFQKANGVGSANAPISDAHIAGGCQWWNKSYHGPCQGSPDNVYAKTLDSTFVPIPPPNVYWDSWYLNASPGPYFPCNAPGGPVPVFDNDQFNAPSPDAVHRNGSVTTPFNLTPSVSYTCKTAGGELSWDATKHALTVRGTIFIDGSAYIQNGATNTYSGQGALYLSGTFLEKNSTLCAQVDQKTGGCDTTHWDPNKALLGIIANGQGGIVNPNDSEQFVSATFQGAVYATHDIDTDTTSAVLGPMLANAVNLGQTVSTAFPKVTIVPASFPGSPAVYAQPQQPVYLNG